MTSRVGRNPIVLPKGVELKVQAQQVSVKGSKGQLQLAVHPVIDVVCQDNVVQFKARDESQATDALLGTMRALTANMIKGVHEGFEKKLKLVGVGYRAQAQGKVLNLTVGYSHPVNFPVPEGIKIETPSQTEITVSGVDKQLVGLVAAKIRDVRPPEPYKGKGICYSDEKIIRKETKKK